MNDIYDLWKLAFSACFNPSNTASLSMYRGCGNQCDATQR